jgi:hypothetical protein
MERKQMFLFRLVDVVNELFAMTASIARAIAMEKRNAPEAAMASDAADMFCKGSRRVVQDRFNALWSNDDDAKVAFSRAVLKGDHVWMEKMVTDLIDARDQNEKASAAK